MADIGSVDTSSYPKPALPVSPLDIVGKIGAIQQQQLAISQAKMDQADKALGYMTRAMGALGPSATKDQYIAAAGNAVKMGLVPPDALNTFIERANAYPNTPQGSQGFYNEFMTAAANHQQQIDYHLGRREDVGNGQQITPSVSSVKPGFGVRPIALPIQQQPPPTAIGNVNGQPTAIGAQPAQLPPGAVPAGNLPGQYRISVERPAPAIEGPVTNPAILGRTNNFIPPGMPAGAPTRVIATDVGPTTNATAAPTPRGYAAGPVPLSEEGRKAITEDQALATQRMTAVKPALQALKIMQSGNLGKTGPVTGQLTELTAAAKALGIVDTKILNDPTVLRQEVEKKLAQYVGSSPAGQRSDAAQVLAEAGSPNPKKQILPALVNLTKDSIILDRVQAARPGAFAGRNDFQNYGQHRASFPQSIDERAFGLDLMPQEDSKKLTDQMYNKYKKNPSNPEALKFFHSLDIAKKQGFYSGVTEE
jgi:hypothetical protein